jgi:transposase-like protein
MTTDATESPDDKPEEHEEAGRALAIVPWDTVDDYLRAGCAGAAVARLLGIHPNTLYRSCMREHGCNFGEYAQEKRAEGDELLRMTQFHLAVDGKDKTMLIWLGKNRLDQRDRSETKHEYSDLTDEQLDQRFAELITKREAGSSADSQGDRATPEAGANSTDA